MIDFSSWETVILKDDEAVQTIFHSPFLTAMATSRNQIRINYENPRGYVLKINTGLMEICTMLRQPKHQEFESKFCKQTIARPAIGLAIVGLLFLMIGTVCTGKFNGFRLNYFFIVVFFL